MIPHSQFQGWWFCQPIGGKKPHYSFPLKCSYPTFEVTRTVRTKLKLLNYWGNIATWSEEGVYLKGTVYIQLVPLASSNNLSHVNNNQERIALLHYLCLFQNLSLYRSLNKQCSGRRWHKGGARNFHQVIAVDQQSETFLGHGPGPSHNFGIQPQLIDVPHITHTALHAGTIYYNATGMWLI